MAEIRVVNFIKTDFRIGCTPYFTFQHLPPSPSTTGYATEEALLVSMHLHTKVHPFISLTLSASSVMFAKGFGTKTGSNIVT